MQRAARRSHRIAFERQGTGRDAWNEPVQEWTPLGSTLAAVFWGAGSERRQAAAEQGQQAASFVVLSTALTRSVGIADRIVFAGYAWDIEGVAPVGPSEIELTALRGATVVTVPANDVGVLDFSDPNNSALLALFEFAAAATGEGGSMDFSEPDNSGLLAAL